MCIRGHEEAVPYGVVSREGHRFVSVEEKPVHSFFVNAGIYALSPSVLGLVEPGQFLNMTDLFSRLVASGREASVYPLREYWLDIGQPVELEQARTDWKEVYKS
jgi:NDP-sugar pyrophosphorylase family protein